MGNQHSRWRSEYLPSPPPSTRIEHIYKCIYIHIYIQRMECTCVSCQRSLVQDGHTQKRKTWEIVTHDYAHKTGLLRVLHKMLHCNSWLKNEYDTTSLFPWLTYQMLNILRRSPNTLVFQVCLSAKNWMYPHKTHNRCNIQHLAYVHPRLDSLEARAPASVASSQQNIAQRYY